MSAEPIETAHLPTFIQEAAGKLHRYLNAGEALAKSELQRLMADIHGLVHQLPAEEGAVEHEVMDFEGRVAEGIRKALPEAEAFLADARQRLTTAESEAAAAKTHADEALTAYQADLTRLAHQSENDMQVLRDQIAELEGELAAALTKPALVIDATVSGEAKPIPQLDVTQSTDTKAPEQAPTG